MANRLIIVESPSKARTLSRFLGSGYTIKASMGHVRDLPKSKLGVDLEGGFAPQYEVTKEAQIKELRAAAKNAVEVILASDPDREGEAIAWHLAEALRLKEPQRVVFHEITRAAVEAALKSPRLIDRDLVAAQEARRVIDRLVGYQLSPFLWKKVRTGLSAGRVQSVAVRLVVDRENDIDAFVPEEWWTVDAQLATDQGATLTARLYARRGEAGEAEGGEEEEISARPAEPGDSKLKLADEAAALQVMAALGVDAEGRPGPDAPPFEVVKVTARESSRSAPNPYTTSTMQQDASTRLRMSPKKSMQIAQDLYEGIELGNEGPVGLITYMRTDSTRISETARDAAHAHIEKAYGKQYAGRGAAKAAKSKAPVAAQDAHEAIRPTDPTRTPESVASHLSAPQAKLYDLIWRRFVASQMAPARFDTTRVDINAGDYIFRATGSVLRFDGFTRVWRRDEEQKDRSLPSLSEGALLALQQLTREGHVTQPPPRYTEASLIKELEERGIGRPSTYAPTIEVIQERKYVRQEERRLHPTELGKTVDGVLRQQFPDIVDVTFTAELEKRLDGVEEGHAGFEATIRAWYVPFADTLEKAETNVERVRVPTKDTGEECPECHEGRLVVREGRFGEFTGCSRYPDCKYIKKDGPAPEPTGEPCPDCGRPLVVRQGKRGPFTGCSGYPDCRYLRDEAAKPAEGEGEAASDDLGVCPECGKKLGRKSGRRGPFVGCTNYPECKYIQPRGAGEPGSRPAAQATGESCPDCGKPLVTRMGRRGPFVGCSGYPKCRHIKGDAPGEGPAEGAPAAVAPGAAPAPAVLDPELGACPDCERPLVKRQGRFGAFVSCSGYPNCKYRPPKATAARTATG
ncbi:MAG TPA: type I DNA topoisomerase [Candidatus Dormibacteraeota bacterium]|jgi:DNA topoisomerase-1|nr:type I DNA topoisomerase [Candidatus Dormibacteraeota bacterium]